MARRRNRKVTMRTWLLRSAIAVLIGVPVGAALGIYSINRLEPPHPTAASDDAADSDSALFSRAAASIREKEAQRQGQVTPEDDQTSSRTPYPAGTTVSVPDLADLEEGDARALLQELGFEVGQVMFRGSPKPIGTVLSTFPVKGERVQLPATINLVLSNGRGRRAGG